MEFARQQDVTIDLDVDEIIDEMSESEKLAMFTTLKEDFEDEILKDFASLMPSEQKRFLCDALGVPSYHDNEGLRQKLETIINAI